MSITEESNTANAWALRESIESKARGRPVYFKEWGATGPIYTDELSEAERFSSQLAAYQSRAYAHSLSFFEPVEVGNWMTDVGEKKISKGSLAAALISDASKVIALAAVSMAESVRAYGETIRALREGKSIPIVETPYADILVDRLRACGVFDGEEKES